uniref:Sec-independent protein translocase protein TatB homolog n=1 Tax=Caldilinea aerophila TaxID=133453 RepID=A0A7C1FGD0_9CHLR
MDSFFGIGVMELFLIAIIALIVLGPERLPGAMRSIANFMRQLRELSNEFTSQFSEEIKMLEEMDPRRIVSDALDPSKTPPPAGSRSANAPSSSAAQTKTRPPTASKPLADTTVSSANSSNTILPPPFDGTQTAQADTSAGQRPPNGAPASSAGQVASLSNAETDDDHSSAQAEAKR